MLFIKAVRERERDREIERERERQRKERERERANTKLDFVAQRMHPGRILTIRC